MKEMKKTMKENFNVKTMKENFNVFTNKESGVTVAKFSYPNGDARAYIMKRTNFLFDFDPYAPKTLNNVSEIVAKVHCHESDEWDEEIGKREALHKADVMHRRHLNFYIKCWMKRVLQALKNVDEGILREVLTEMRH